MDNKLLNIDAVKEIKDYVDNSITNIDLPEAEFEIMDTEYSIRLDHTKSISISDKVRTEFNNYVASWTDAEIDVQRPIHVCFGRYSQGGENLIQARFCLGTRLGIIGTSGRGYAYYAVVPNEWFNSSTPDGRNCVLQLLLMVGGEPGSYVLNTLSLKYYDAPYALSSSLNSYLSKTNTTSFTPTADYNPATKKYVDDSVATLGDYVDEQLANIDAGGNSNSSSIPEYVLEASYTEFVNTNGDGIHQKVEVLRPDEQTFTNVKAIFADVVEKDIRVFNIRLKNINDNKDHCLLTCNTGGHPSYSGMNYVTFSGIYTKDSLNTITEIHLGITFMDGGINPPTSMNWYRYTMKGYSSYAFKSDLNTYGLSKTNTTEFTPTADYHPSTKKYVDDAISTAITTALEAEY